MIKTICNYCPKCGTHSRDIKMLKRTWRGKVPRLFWPKQIAREVLLCKCGIKLTWWLMKKEAK